jgi:DnaK suppressor protein
MVAQQRRREKAVLRQARKEALTELSHLRKEMQCEVDFEVDEADAQITEHQTDAVLITLLEHKVQEVDHALAAIEQGRYGICEQCGQPIKQERLDAKADARFCFDCQQALEMQV